MVRKLLLIYLGLINIIDCYQFLYFNFKTKIYKSMTDSIINFIKINNINNLKIKENSKYLILNYNNEKLKKDDDKINKINDKINKINDNLIDIIDNRIYIKNELDIFNDNNNEIITNEDNSIYERIITNKKPILIISERRDDSKLLSYKYRYLIKDKDNYTCSFLFKYNNKNYKYFFDICSEEINRYETDWDINAKIRVENNNKNDMGINLMNWIKYNTYDNFNNRNYYYKKYLLINYYYNNNKE